MGNPKGFIEIQRKVAGYRPLNERTSDFGEVEQTLNEQDRKDQAARCMDCGVPFCQWGCPVMNNMPEWQDAIYKGDWKNAIDLLHVTNNFPEFTGRICPAPCENACTLNIGNEPVTIRENEAAAAERAFEAGFIVARPPQVRTGIKIAVVGSGPAGMACADLLNKWGHTVTLFEKDDAIGGLLRYGIPDFKLNKRVIDRRLEILAQEGLIFKTGTFVGRDIKGESMLKDFDAICLTIGAMKPRDLTVEGSDLKGIHYAMEFLTQQNKINRGIKIADEDRILATGKNVVVIGGGDTGSDCVGTSIRQGAKSVTQIEIMPKPSEKRKADNPWPYWANVLRYSSSHEEGCERKWSLSTKKCIGEKGQIKQLEVVEVDWVSNNGKMNLVEKPETKHFMKADLVLLAMGFVHCVHEGIAEEFGLEFDARGNIKVDQHFQTSKSKVFAAGDAAIGASLVVRAIAQGRNLARSVDKYLKKNNG
ncbi:MAG TPA: glutamate synthase subunit beta [Bacteroidales bacterium]|nr:glutamate synthase subunit beta [Bacteroidales bacterium]